MERRSLVLVHGYDGDIEGRGTAAVKYQLCIRSPKWFGTEYLLLLTIYGFHIALVSDPPPGVQTDEPIDLEPS